MLLLSSADFSKINFSKISFRNTDRVSNSLDPHKDWTDKMSVLIWVQSACKAYQQTTKVAASKDTVQRTSTKERMHSELFYSAVHKTVRKHFKNNQMNS